MKLGQPSSRRATLSVKQVTPGHGDGGGTQSWEGVVRGPLTAGAGLLLQLMFSFCEPYVCIMYVHFPIKIIH